MTSFLMRVFLSLAAIICFVSCRETPPDPPPAVPNAPELFAITDQSETTLNLSWNDKATDEDGFIVQRFLDPSWHTQDNVPAHNGTGNVQAALSNLSPGTTYRLRVVAFNEAGNSTPSNEREATTEGDTMPPAPTNVHAEALTFSAVRVWWTDNGVVDDYLIQRRTPAESWANLDSVPDNDVEYLDETVAPATTYYYRVGGRDPRGISWSADSAAVTMPVEGAPEQPDSLWAEVHVGSHITLRWIDASSNEDGFELQRGESGQQFALIASPAANVVAYDDNLGDNDGIYNYRIRAYNNLGMSDWTILAAVDYRNCSPGAIPLCEGNYWDYLIADSIGEDYEIREQALSPELIGGLDWYLIRSTRINTQLVDTLHYLRNSASAGTYFMPYPAATSSILYRWPAALGSYSIVNGDCVFVAGTNQIVEVGDTTFTGCVIYQRDYAARPSRSDQIYLHPYDIGIVRVVQHDNSTVVGTRSIIGWRVQN